MTVVLGIHAGHEASCAVVRDGVVVAAIQQERVTRRKYDGQECLSNALPIHAVLEAAGCGMSDVDYIVSEFQAVGVSGVGLQRPLFTADFDVFDPFDERHWVVSHHLAHAASAAFASPFDSCAVLVSDSAGSTTTDGRDYVLPFRTFHAHNAGDAVGVSFMTEMRSIYRFRSRALELLDRDYATPHNQPDVYVQSEASLYDNVARFVFRDEHCHGQFMALGGLDHTGAPRLPFSALLTSEDPPRLRNGWQGFRASKEVTDNADVADVVQQAFTELVVTQARRALSLAHESRLACAGGVFLNLAGNSAVDALEEVDALFVPSSPHDAGASVGAALVGYWQIAVGAGVEHPDGGRRSGEPVSDYLGAEAESVDPTATDAEGFVVEYVRPSDPEGPGALVRRVAEELASGAILARYAGRSEFGPRALGNRSLLAHPVHAIGAKDKLNAVKRRQGWRPVAPMVRAEDVTRFFHGPRASPYMNYNYTVREEHRESLSELMHDDGTARVQTVTEAGNPFLHGLLSALEDSGSVPILLNTSLNGPGQPIIEQAEALLRFARHPLIDKIVTETQLIDCRTESRDVLVTRTEATVMALFGHGADTRHVLSNASGQCRLDARVFEELIRNEVAATQMSVDGVREAINRGLLVAAT